VSVTAITAVDDPSCSNWFLGEFVMMYDNMCSALLIDDRNERPLMVALIAIAAAWSIIFLLGL
jgi:hypothetical protein